MDSVKELGLFVLTGMIALVAYFLRTIKDETDKKITTLFNEAKDLRENQANIRERLARLEK
jgi:hypothetical protein